MQSEIRGSSRISRLGLGEIVTRRSLLLPSILRDRIILSTESGRWCSESYPLLWRKSSSFSCGEMHPNKFSSDGGFGPVRNSTISLYPPSTCVNARHNKSGRNRMQSAISLVDITMAAPVKRRIFRGGRDLRKNDLICGIYLGMRSSSQVSDGISSNNSSKAGRQRLSKGQKF
ncbi:hypothetical protein BD410DRAFT_614301 [Rickenella mellea]|uniref:Uncharacterized protein n=1 Tax=Rickenella mellea TaxID=50990 RepID=A0A4Y7PMN3_9AGAM|nr:hypothetical protein BD410DRAFT_614301 [Rickenella mellea]